MATNNTPNPNPAPSRPRPRHPPSSSLKRLNCLPACNAMDALDQRLRANQGSAMSNPNGNDVCRTVSAGLDQVRRSVEAGNSLRLALIASSYGSQPDRVLVYCIAQK